MYENATTGTDCSAKQCLKPSRSIRKGERIFHSTASAKDYHEACAAAQFSKKPQANPITTPRNEGRASNDGIPHALPDASKLVDARLARAFEIVDKRRPDAKGYADYLTMVTEVLHQLNSVKWLQYEKTKSQGIA